MKGIIGFKDLQIHCIIGIYPEERTKSQDIFIDLKVAYDLTDCVQTQSIEKALDYTKLAAICQEIAEKGYLLIEALAYDILDKIFKNFTITWVWIKIKKPQAIPKAHHAFVELERGSNS